MTWRAFKTKGNNYAIFKKHLDEDEPHFEGTLTLDNAIILMKDLKIIMREISEIAEMAKQIYNA